MLLKCHHKDSNNLSIFVWRHRLTITTIKLSAAILLILPWLHDAKLKHFQSFPIIRMRTIDYWRTQSGNEIMGQLKCNYEGEMWLYIFPIYWRCSLTLTIETEALLQSIQQQLSGKYEFDFNIDCKLKFRKTTFWISWLIYVSKMMKQ